jgi:predicted protein tyrosine phosphatase
MTEVCRGLFLGNKKNSEDLGWLTAEKITTIVNATDDLPNCHSHLEYLRLSLEDVPSADLRGFLDDEDGVLALLARSLSSGTRVLVHCRVGSSRSASIVLAHFVKNGRVSLFDAFTQLRQIHSIKPNSGFTKQLIDFELDVHGSSSVLIDGFGNWKAAS